MPASSALSLNTADYVEFFLFVAVLSLVGFFSGRGERASSSEYFLAGRKLRWYVVGASYIAANISTEQFIGMVGASYLLGIVPALWEWLHVFTFLFITYPSGLALYWLASNVLLIGQQMLTNYLIGPPTIRVPRPPAERRLKKVGEGKTPDTERQELAE